MGAQGLLQVVLRNAPTTATVLSLLEQRFENDYQLKKVLQKKGGGTFDSPSFPVNYVFAARTVIQQLI